MAADYHVVVDKPVQVRDDEVNDIALDVQCTADVNDVYKPLLMSALMSYYDGVNVDNVTVNTAVLTVKVLYSYENWYTLTWKNLVVVVNLSVGVNGKEENQRVVATHSVAYTTTMPDNPPAIEFDGHDLIAACGMMEAYVKMYALAKQKLQLVYGTMELKKK